MRKMSKKEREAFVQKNAARRTELRTQIQDLAKKRQAHIHKEIAKRKLNYKASFDHGLYEAIKHQAGKKDIKYTGALKH